jgi:NitT/TauT family transport system substrate-binding protein
VIKTLVVAGLLASVLHGLSDPAAAQAPKIKVGRTTGASGFHLPSYVAMDKGIFKAEGLDVEFVNMTAGELVRATIAKEVDFTPIPGGGSEAMLKGAPLVFVVGESLISQWTIVTPPTIDKVEDLKGKTLGLGRPGSADYNEPVVLLGKFFKMEAGRDYKVIFMRGEPERIAAMIQGSIQGAILSFPHAARAEAEGLKVLVRTGDYMPRLGGTVHTHRDNLRDKREVVKRFVRSIAKAADCQLFESVATPQLGWPEGKPLPDLEQFVARDLLNGVLKELGKATD